MNDATPEAARSRSAHAFDLNDITAYTVWREHKLAHYPRDVGELKVELGDLGAPRFADGDPARGALAEIPTVAARRGKWMRFADSAIAPLEVADLATAGVTLSASVIGALLWAQTAAEISKLETRNVSRMVCSGTPDCDT